ncbi:MAG TPA: hypothetical protein PKL71_02510 [Marmoricola sp.]|nr:hypothetical protein [Marmoricola sp.]
MSGYAETLLAWVDHLRSGGTQNWTDFAASHGTSANEVGDHRHHEYLPTATQLRLLELLLPRVDRKPQLVDLICATPAPGRGLVDIPLTWPVESPFGTPAHPPEEVPANEILRQAIAVLVALLGRNQPPPPAETSPAPLPLPWRQRFQVHGAPIAADIVRQDLTKQRHHESTYRPIHLLLGNPLEVMMAEFWTQRAHRGGIIRWHSLWQQAIKNGGLPRPMNLAARARELQAQGADLVIVIGSDTEAAHALAVDHLGRRPMVPAPPANPAGTDAIRRCNRLLGQTLGADLLDQWRPTLLRLLSFPDREPLGVPADALDWAVAQAQAQVQQLSEGGYAVVGDLGTLLPDQDPTIPRRVRADRTLPVVLHGLEQAWKEMQWPGE